MEFNSHCNRRKESSQWGSTNSSDWFEGWNRCVVLLEVASFEYQNATDNMTVDELTMKLHGFFT